VRRERLGPHKLFEKFNHFRLARNFSNSPFMIFGQERRGFVAGELLVFVEKFGVFIGLRKAS
jgi:hypothetical protein